MARVSSILAVLTNLFPIWVLLGGVLAMFEPALICASIIGQRAAQIREHAGVLLLAVALLHSGGFTLGWVIARVFGYSEELRRTLSIEVGMQNSGLGMVLADSNFPALPSTAAPCAISAVFHSILGSLLAGIWRMFPAKSNGRTVEVKDDKLVVSESEQGK